MTVYAFTNNANPERKSKAHDDLNEIVGNIRNSQHFNLTRDGIVKWFGWAYDYRDEMKKYVVKDSSGSIFEMWAPNKTSIRKGYGKVCYIIELPTKYFR